MEQLIDVLGKLPQLEGPDEQPHVFCHVDLVLADQERRHGLGGRICQRCRNVAGPAKLDDQHVDVVTLANAV
jgi:hypothetical protein